MARRTTRRTSSRRKTFQKKTKKGSYVSTTYVPRNKASKKVKMWKQKVGSGSKRMTMVQVVMQKAFPSAKAANAYRRKHTGKKTQAFRM